MELTDWYPATVTPMRTGEYDVIEVGKEVKDANCVRAEFCTRYTQTGFWLLQASQKGRTWRLLNAAYWRGIFRLERVKLLPEDTPVQRRKLNAK